MLYSPLAQQTVSSTLKSISITAFKSNKKLIKNTSFGTHNVHHIRHMAWQTMKETSNCMLRRHSNLHTSTSISIVSRLISWKQNLCMGQSNNQFLHSMIHIDGKANETRYESREKETPATQHTAFETQKFQIRINSNSKLPVLLENLFISNRI